MPPSAHGQRRDSVADRGGLGGLLEGPPGVAKEHVEHPDLGARTSASRLRAPKDHAAAGRDPAASRCGESLHAWALGRPKLRRSRMQVAAVVLSSPSAARAASCATPNASKVESYQSGWPARRPEAHPGSARSRDRATRTRRRCQLRLSVAQERQVSSPKLGGHRRSGPHPGGCPTRWTRFVGGSSSDESRSTYYILGGPEDPRDAGTRTRGARGRPSPASRWDRSLLRYPVRLADPIPIVPPRAGAGPGGATIQCVPAPVDTGP